MNKLKADVDKLYGIPRSRCIIFPKKKKKLGKSMATYQENTTHLYGKGYSRLSLHRERSFSILIIIMFSIVILLMYCMIQSAYVYTLVPRGDRISLCGKICHRGPVQKGRLFLAINWIFDVSIRFLRVLGLFPSGNPRVMLQIPWQQLQGAYISLDGKLS